MKEEIMCILTIIIIILISALITYNEGDCFIQHVIVITIITLFVLWFLFIYPNRYPSEEEIRKSSEELQKIRNKKEGIE
jgi:membrane protein YdbS with pleckstrin-like domain